MPCGQYGRADACVAKATAIANATPATNVFMVSSPISLDAYSGNPVMHSVMAVTESCFLLGGLLLRTTKAAGSGVRAWHNLRYASGETAVPATVVKLLECLIAV